MPHHTTQTSPRRFYTLYILQMEHLTRKQRDEVLTEFETQYKEAERTLEWLKHNRGTEQTERALELGQKLAAADF